MDDDDELLEEGQIRSKTVRLPADIWNPIVLQSRKHHCKTSQVIRSILGAYFDSNAGTSLLPYQCPICLRINEPMANYCSECGHPLNKSAAEDMKNFKDYINKFKTDPAVVREYAAWLERNKKK